MYLSLHFHKHPKYGNICFIRIHHHNIVRFSFFGTIHPYHPSKSFWASETLMASRLWRSQPSLSSPLSICWQVVNEHLGWSINYFIYFDKYYTALSLFNSDSLSNLVLSYPHSELWSFFFYLNLNNTDSCFPQNISNLRKNFNFTNIF